MTSVKVLSDSSSVLSLRRPDASKETKVTCLKRENQLSRKMTSFDLLVESTI